MITASVKSASVIVVAETFAIIIWPSSPPSDARNTTGCRPVVDCSGDRLDSVCGRSPANRSLLEVTMGWIACHCGSESKRAPGRGEGVRHHLVVGEPEAQARQHEDSDPTSACC